MFQNSLGIIIFILTIISTSIFFFNLILPNYIISNTVEIIPDGVEKEKLSFWAIPLFISNSVFFILYILYKKEKFPRKVSNLLNKIQNIEFSKKTTFVILVSIISFYIVFSVDELLLEEVELGDYQAAKEGALNWYTVLENEGFYISPVLRYLLLFISLEFLGNIRILPFIASIGLVILIYFLTKEISGKRFSGIIATCALIQSNLFLIYDTTSTYENFWTFFYFLSLYLIVKNSMTSSISYVVSLFLKVLVVVFLPINLFWVFIQKQTTNKIKLSIGFVSIVAVILFAFFSGDLLHTHPDGVGFNLEKFVLGFNEINNSLRFDNLILLVFIPLIFLLFVQSRNKNSNKIFVLFGILIMLISQPLLYSIIEMTIQPYRFIPLVVFVAIGLGIIFEKNKENS